MSTLSKAEAAFQHARNVDTCEAWKAAALALYAVRPGPKAPRKSKGRCRYPFPVAVATFADGVTIRRTFFSPVGKPTDWNRAAIICERGYRYERAMQAVRANWSALTTTDWRGRVRRNASGFEAVVGAVTVPPVLSMVDETTGERRDAELREAA